MFEKVKHEKLRPDTCPQDSEITGGKREGEEDSPQQNYEVGESIQISVPFIFLSVPLPRKRMVLL